MEPKQFFESRQIDGSLGVQRADGAFEIAHGLQDVQNLDFVDEPVEPQPDCRVRNAVRLRQFLQRSGSQKKSLEEGEVLIIENVDPARHGRILSKLKTMSIKLIFLFMSIDYIEG